ncbi:hypothetical protein [Streptomyces sp. NPDC048638]|uniref:hypothetical protein n=1 Tax=Streptomyces sp. NPDC048638 TaxID=3365580 RepID=UPI0037247029
MTRAGSNDRKSKARKIAKAKRIPLAEAHARLLATKNRPRRDPAPQAPAPAAADEDQEHEFGVHHTLPDGQSEIAYGDAAAYVLWLHDDPSLRASCRCGWSNPHAGPRFPDLRDRYGIEPDEQGHWRSYHLGAWAVHRSAAMGDPPLAEMLADPSMTLHDLSQEFALSLRTFLDQAQDFPERTAGLYEQVAACVAQERRRHIWEPHHGGERPDRADLQNLPEELRIGLEALVGRADERHGPGELWLAQHHAEKLRRLVLGPPKPAPTA